MLPTFMHKRMRPRLPDAPATTTAIRVCLVPSPHLFLDELRPFWGVVGTVEGMVGDLVLVRFGETVLQLPPDWLEPATP